MYKVALVTPMLQPYRISFYEKLSKYDSEYDWTIYHGVKKTEDGRPAFKGETNFKNVGCEEVTYNAGPFQFVYLKGLMKSVRKLNPDVVIAQGIAGNISNRMFISWAKKNKKTLILWTCGWEPGRAKGFMLKLKNYFVATYFRKANLHLTYSTKANSYVEEMGVASENIITCYNGIEIDHLVKDEENIISQSAEITDNLKLQDKITFLYVGGLIYEKRVDLLVEAFSSLYASYKNIKLVIIGDGPMRNELQKQIKEANIDDIHYLGRIIDGVDKYFAASDCFVLPGVGGLALNQAMFWKKPCIVSEADGTEDDLVKDNITGFRFEKSNLESLKSAMENYIKLTDEDKNKMAIEARRIISEKSNVNNMVEIFMTNIIRMTTNKTQVR